jgi:TonB-linked SusC/RagA family outer membrane protein
MRKQLLFYCLMCLSALSSMAQTLPVTGTVTDQQKAPLEAVTVLVVGTSTSTMTDAKGQFSIRAAIGQVLAFSLIGAEPVRVTINRSAPLNVVLNTGTNTLNDVVVTGYATQRKKDLTGAVAIVDLAPVTNNSTGNTMQALQGRVAGLYIERNGSANGATSRILIRGANTLGNTNPLYIIDGIPTTRPEVFQNLSPSNISSVQVLKDASAASIYGARASNGVIIVTTKNGGNTNGAVQFQLNSSTSFQTEKPFRFKMLNAVDRGKALWQASINDGQNPTEAYGEIYNFDWNNSFTNPILNSVTVKPLVGGDPNTPAGDTDWQDVVYKTAVVTNNDFNASFGNQNSSVQINFADLRNSGLARFTRYKRTSGSINAITRAFDGHATFGVNLRLANSNERLTSTDLGGAPVPSLAVTLAPTIPVYQKDGTSYAGESGAGYSDRNNALHVLDLAKWNNANRVNTFGNVFVEIEPIKNLFFRSTFGADNNTFENKIISPTFTEGALSRTTNSLFFDENHFLSTTFSNTLRYNYDLNSDNNFKLLIGTEYVKTDVKYRTTLKQGFAIQTEEYFTIDAGTGNSVVTGRSTGNRLFSQFARADYSHAGKYLASVTVRRDGSSRFGLDKQYGVFPAASIGWRIGQENFLKESKVFSDLKIRLGAGRVGNQEIGDLSRFALYDTRYGTVQSQLTPGFWEDYMNIGTAYSLSGANTGSLPSGFVQTQAANPGLRWETTDEINAGLDFSLFRDKISGSFDYFTRKTSGILITPPVASALGEGQSKTVNGAAKTNRGWEFLVTYSGQQSGDFNYNVTLNFSHFRDKITSLPENVRPAYPGNLVNTILGRSQFDIFGYKTNGLFQSQAEVDAAPTQIGAGPGRIRYVDLNGDNVINDLDQTWIGTSLPALEYGARIDLTYKKFDLSIFGSGVSGRRGFDIYTFFNSLMRSRENVGPGVLNGWTPQNTGSTIPLITLKDNNNELRTSDYFILSTAYFKIRNVQLGYSIEPKKVFTKVRVFGMAENILTLKSGDFNSPDPERTDLGLVPIPRVFSFGINASF